MSNTSTTPDSPRLRFCPAPSGWLHVGSARTALFNWLYARHTGGAFVVRIEDTDVERSSEDSAEAILDGLRFLGLDWDEGPHAGGAHGPYQQSERSPLYAAVVAALLEAGAAYDAYETPEELDAARKKAQAEGRPPGYDGAHRDLTDEQRDGFRAEGRRPAIRLRTPDDGQLTVADKVRGDVSFSWSDIPDLVVQRADGTPTYYLANTVDDLAMGIDIVARGEDLLSATPRQLLLYDLLLRDGLLDEALSDNAYPARPPAAAAPTFAHLPMLVGQDRKKLSKRHGSVAVDEFRRQGFLPEVLVNVLALCGWSAGDAASERLSVDELVKRFDFDRVGSNPAYFDTDKLRAFNGDRIKELSPPELAGRLVPYFVMAGLVADPPEPDELALIEALTPLLQERIQTLAEAVPLVAFCFRDEVEYDQAAVAKHLKGRAGEVLDAATSALESLPDWSGDALMSALDGVAEQLVLGRGKTFQPVRVAVAGTAVSPPLPETLAVLDRDLVVARLRAARGMVVEEAGG